MSFTPEERTFTLMNGLVIAAKHWRNANTRLPRDRRRFLAMHGLLDNAASFDLLAPLLLEQLGPEPVEILSIDLAGHGLSSHRGTEDHSRWRYVDEADQVAEQMGWTTHALIGHSMGGEIATMYAGLFPERVTLCVSLDTFGPYTLPLDEQPDRILKFLADKRVIAMKQDAFFTSVHAAVRARTNGNKNSSWPIREEVAAVFIPRSLKPAEKKDEDTQIVQKGYTWRWDRMIMIADVMTNSDLFHKAFLRRIICPLLFVLAIDGLAYKNEKAVSRRAWLTSCPSVTVRNVNGSHHFHIEDAPMTARIISEWVLAQDSSEKARL